MLLVGTTHIRFFLSTKQLSMNKTRKKSICQLFHEIKIFLDFFFEPRLFVVQETNK